MSIDTNGHPPPETMAAFLDGTLGPAQLEIVTAHLRACANCRIVISEAARFERTPVGAEVGDVATRAKALATADSASIPRPAQSSVEAVPPLVRSSADAQSPASGSIGTTAYSSVNAAHASHPSPGDVPSPTQASTSADPRGASASLDPGRRPARWPWFAAAAAVIAAVALFALLRPRSPVDALIAAAPPEHRQVEARLAGFPWARLQAPSRGTALTDPADLKLSGAAGNVLDSTASSSSVEAQHARGAALLLIGRNAGAVAELEEAARGSRDGHVWNDLAAARYALGTLPSALTAADEALAIDPRSPEALFNRALIVERLRGGRIARIAWQRYLAADPASDWSTEARSHLRRLTE